MSDYEGLPMYRAAADVVVTLDEAVRAFPCYHKYTLGSRLRDTAIDLVLRVARCNLREERAERLPELCMRIEELKLLVNIGKEVAAFCSFKEFVHITEQVVALARQAEGWRRSLCEVGTRTEPTGRTKVVSRRAHVPPRAVCPPGLSAGHRRSRAGSPAGAPVTASTLQLWLPGFGPSGGKP